MREKKKIIVTGKLDPVIEKIFGEEKSWLEFDNLPDVPREKLLEIIGDYHCIVSRSETDIDKTLIDAGQKLEVVARAAVGIGNIDVDYATEKGILVFNTPLVNTNSAAELTLGLILASARKIVPAHSNMVAGGWERHRFTGVELRGKTVGIVGLGNVGSRVAKFLNAMECRLIGHDPLVNASRFADLNCEKVSLDSLLERSDILTLHVPKTKDTVDLISRAGFARMKKGCILVNAARGGVVNEEALVEALEKGIVGAAGVDTWGIEPVNDHPLKAFEQVTMTPHIGASTHEAQFKIAQSVARESVLALKSQYADNPVNLPKVSSLKGSSAPKYANLAEKLGLFLSQFMEADFRVTRVDFLYRGDFRSDDWELIKIAFFKGFFASRTAEVVSYVNALKIAEFRNIKIHECGDKDFTDYVSAIRIKVSGSSKSYVIGGTVVGENRLRMSYLQNMSFEVEPVGEIIVVENLDSLGVVGHVGSKLAESGININQFVLSRTKPGECALAIVLVDDFVSDTILERIAEFKEIQSVKRISI